MWNPAQYERFRDERKRPFFELLARVDAAAPRRWWTWAVARET